MPHKRKLAAAEEALRLSEERLRVALKQEVTERKRLEGEILRILETERRRIGQELHDGICQHLAGIELKCQSLALNLEKKAKRQAAQAEQIALQVREAIGQTRSLARGLSAFILDADGCVSALKELAANTGKMFRVQCQFQTGGRVSISDSTVATHLYRIAQEAVANALRHGKASAVVISLDNTGGETVLAVTDNGTGLASPVQAGSGMGLRSMQYRAGMIGATLRVQAPAEGGTRILCVLQNPRSRPPK